MKHKCAESNCWFIKHKYSISSKIVSLENSLRRQDILKLLALHSPTGFSLVVVVVMQCRQVGIYTQPNLQTQPLEQMYKDFLAGDQLLGDEGSNGNHGKSAIVQLLALHVLPGRRVGGEQTQGVESKVTRLVVVSQGVEVLRSGSSPSQTHSVCLAQTDGEQKWLPEHSTAGLNLLEMVDSRT